MDQRTFQNHLSRSRFSYLLMGVAVFSLTGLLGCQTLNNWSLPGMGASDDLANIDDIRGPLERRLQGRERLVGTSLRSPQGHRELERVQELSQQKKHAATEKAAYRLSKKYKNSPIREDALFLIAESQFHQMRYAKAADSYELLIKEFPATRYGKTRNRRLFKIAKHWLASDDYITPNDVKLVGHTNSVTVKPSKKSQGFWKDPTLMIPILPNFHDKSRPTFDTENRGLQLLQSIWEHDSTSELADDSLMLTASHHLKNNNNIEAAYTYQILREQYPKSPHIPNAYVLNSYVERASYDGPGYDAKPLQRSLALKEHILRMRPNHADADRIRDEIRQIKESSAEADWKRVLYYQRKGKKQSVEVYCREIIRQFPSSAYADKARNKLRSMKLPVDSYQSRKPVLQRDGIPPLTEPEPRRLLSFPKIRIPFLGKKPVKKERPPIRDSRNTPEHSPVGHARL